MKSNLIQRATWVTGLVLLLGLASSLYAASNDKEWNFDVKPGGTLNVVSDAGSIDVETWKQNAVRVIVRNAQRYDSNELELRVEKHGDDVDIRADIRGSRRNMRISFRIMVPDQYHVDLHTGGGSIEVDDITGEVQVETSGGSIRIGDVIGGSVNADTSGGSINIGNVDGDVDANTAGGSIRVGNVGGNGDIRTAGGSIRVGMVQGPLSVHTSGGSIRLDGSEDSVRADTSGGSINIKRSAGSVEASTSGGSITIGEAGGYIEADTAGGSIEATLSVSADDSHITLESSGGDITLTIPAGHAATVNADLRVSRRYRGDYRIYTDFPLTIEDENERRIIGRGDINGGGASIRLSTSNGDISILSLD